MNVLKNIEKEVEKIGNHIADKVALAVVDGFEKGAKILGDIIANKMDELHERDKKS